jgi:hypothetical protein
MSPDQAALVLFNREVLLPEAIAEAVGAKVAWKPEVDDSTEEVG